MTLEDFNKRKYKRTNKSYFFGKRAEVNPIYRQSVVEKYEKMRAAKGDLFEKSVQPIEQEEFALIRKRKRRANRYLYIGAGVLLILFGFFTLVAPPEKRFNNPFEIIEILFVLLIIYGVWYTINRNFNRILEAKEKEVLKGVITDKFRAKEKGSENYAEFFFELSLQEFVWVSQSDYKNFRLGDCIQIEILSEDTSIKRKVFKTSQLPTH